jgi:hypothetical protein
VNDNAVRAAEFGEPCGKNGVRLIRLAGFANRCDMVYIDTEFYHNGKSPRQLNDSKNTRIAKLTQETIQNAG